MNDRRGSVLEGATLVVLVAGPVTDEEIFGALGKRVTDKVGRLAVLTDKDRLRVMRWVVGGP